MIFCKFFENVLKMGFRKRSSAKMSKKKPCADKNLASPARVAEVKIAVKLTKPDK
jgi:hypothetical protein